MENQSKNPQLIELPERANINKQTILVAGAENFIGMAITHRLHYLNYKDIISVQSRDFLRSDIAEEIFKKAKPHTVIHCAGSLGGIQEQLLHPVDYMSEHLTLNNNIILGTHRADINNLLFVGAPSMYPENVKYPVEEESLFEGPSEEAKRSYAVAKLSGYQLCQAITHQYRRNYLTLIPTNLFGPGDHFDPEKSHVLAALLIRVLHAKMLNQMSVEVWGTGEAQREFLYIEDFADAVAFFLGKKYLGSHINVGSGFTISIKDLALEIEKACGYSGTLKFNTDKPEGNKVKTLCSNKIHQLGWKAKTPFIQGLEQTYRWAVENIL